MWHLELNFVVFLLYFAAAVFAFDGNTTDRVALLELKGKITYDPLGIKPLWNDTTHFCQCYGVTCSRRHQRVTVINLRSSQLGGSISPYIGNLSFLRELNLLNNSFSHQIPSEIGRLHRLQRLKLANNSFIGRIPPNISACSELSVLFLEYNQFHGEIPKELGMLLKLQFLTLQKASLSGSIPSSIGNLSSLQVLSAPENFLTGRIPDSLGQLKDVWFFSLAANSLSGTISPSIYNISSIKIFNVAANNISGRLPLNLGIRLPNLELFAIAMNEFEGSIPASISNATNLAQLVLSNNQLTGEVPFFEQLQKLVVLSFSYNHLGSMSANDLSFLLSLMNSTNLWLVEFSNNRFGGVLPQSISNFSTSLGRLSLEDNNISGRFPTRIANLVNLEVLGMSNNRLSGNIPFDIGKLQSLKKLNLDRNNLSGMLPYSLGNLTLLFELRLNYNNLHGSIPPTLAGCRNLALFDIAGNNLNGTIPSQVISLPSLSIFVDMSGNHFTGSIPIQVGNLKNIGELGISDNLLSGTIPDSLGSCVKLEVLALQGNFFHGPIPSSLSSLRGLRELDVSRNNLSGNIPEFLQDFKLLQSLNLSYNNFEGIMPAEGIFKNASAALVMGNDDLCGGIPDFHLPSCKFEKPKRRIPLKIIISIVCALLGLMLMLAFLLHCCLPKKKKELTSNTIENLFLNVSYQSLLRATGGFSSANLIGIGSFGRVYKGTLDEGQRTVAVKVINLLHHGASRSFIAECEALKSIRHRNLVKVITACSGIDYNGNDFKALVYEFMENGNLEEWLHPIPGTEEVDHEPPKSLNLLQRLNIAIDVACALDYLHHQCVTPIVHCDLKPSNVLLDAEMNGRVSDFGVARILSENINNSSTNQSSSIGVRGTIGYTPPEYGVGSQVSTYGDVYSYGILLLELFTGKRPTDDIFKEGLNLHNLAEASSLEQVAKIADPSLLHETAEIRNNRRSQAIHECLYSTFRIGVACSVDSPAERMRFNDVVVKLQLIKGKLDRSRN